MGGTCARTPGAFAKERAFGAIAALGSGAAGSFRLPKEFEVAVTDRRLLVFGRSNWTGRPDELIMELDRTEVVTAALVSDARKIYVIEVGLTGGRHLVLEVAKAGAQALAESFVALVDSAPATQSR